MRERSAREERWDLECGSMSFADWLSSVIAPALGVKTIPNLLDTKQYTHGHRICPHHCSTWAHGLCTPCRVLCEKEELDNRSAFGGCFSGIGGD